MHASRVGILGKKRKKRKNSISEFCLWGKADWGWDDICRTGIDLVGIDPVAGRSPSVELAL